MARHFSICQFRDDNWRSFTTTTFFFFAAVKVLWIIDLQSLKPGGYLNTYIGRDSSLNDFFLTTTMLPKMDTSGISPVATCCAEMNLRYTCRASICTRRLFSLFFIALLLHGISNSFVIYPFVILCSDQTQAWLRRHESTHTSVFVLSSFHKLCIVTFWAEQNDLLPIVELR